MLADDRGLQGCFKVANIQQEWAQDFITKHKLVTLDDYIYSVAHDTWEKGVETLVSQVPTLRDNMIALARFRSAFDIGREALRQALAPGCSASNEECRFGRASARGDYEVSQPGLGSPVQFAAGSVVGAL